MKISTIKYDLLSIYRPPNQYINFFLDKLSEALDSLTCRSYKHSWNDFLKNKFAIQSEDIGSLKTATKKSLNAVATFKKRIVRGNNKPHLTSFITNEIMTRSRLKNQVNKSGKEEDLKAYKKQRNLVLKRNRKAKKTSSKVVSPLTIK